MAKTKESKGVQNRHIYNRASYLFQAATYLANQQHNLESASSKIDSNNEQYSASTPNQDAGKVTRNISRHLISDFRSVTLKAQLRQSPAMKRAICKFCDSVQIEGQTCHSTIENPSKGGRKPWADVLAVRCVTCGHVKRYPVSATKQKRRNLRDKEAESKKADSEKSTHIGEQSKEPGPEP